jgi:hypothetical protein
MQIRRSVAKWMSSGRTHASTSARSIVPSAALATTRGCTPPSEDVPPCSYMWMCAALPTTYSLPRTSHQVHTASRLPIVPLGTNSPSSLANSVATSRSSCVTVGSSLITSSPHSADAIAARIYAAGVCDAAAGLGRVRADATLRKQACALGRAFLPGKAHAPRAWAASRCRCAGRCARAAAAPTSCRWRARPPWRCAAQRQRTP